MNNQTSLTILVSPLFPETGVLLTSQSDFVVIFSRYTSVSKVRTCLSRPRRSKDFSLVFMCNREMSGSSPFGLFGTDCAGNLPLGSRFGPGFMGSHRSWVANVKRNGGTRRISPLKGNWLTGLSFSLVKKKELDAGSKCWHCCSCRFDLTYNITLFAPDFGLYRVPFSHFFLSSYTAFTRQNWEGGGLSCPIFIECR